MAGTIVLVAPRPREPKPDCANRLITTTPLCPSLRVPCSQWPGRNSTVAVASRLYRLRLITADPLSLCKRTV
jgi:hypothetical protein